MITRHLQATCIILLLATSLGVRAGFAQNKPNAKPTVETDTSVKKDVSVANKEKPAAAPIDATYGAPPPGANASGETNPGSSTGPRPTPSTAPLPKAISTPAPAAAPYPQLTKLDPKLLKDNPAAQTFQAPLMKESERNALYFNWIAVFVLSTGTVIGLVIFKSLPPKETTGAPLSLDAASDAYDGKKTEPTPPSTAVEPDAATSVAEVKPAETATDAVAEVKPAETATDAVAEVKPAETATDSTVVASAPVVVEAAEGSSTPESGDADSSTKESTT